MQVLDSCKQLVIYRDRRFGFDEEEELIRLLRYKGIDGYVCRDMAFAIDSFNCLTRNGNDVVGIFDSGSVPSTTEFDVSGRELVATDLVNYSEASYEILAIFDRFLYLVDRNFGLGFEIPGFAYRSAICQATVTNGESIVRFFISNSDVRLPCKENSIKGTEFNFSYNVFRGKFGRGNLVELLGTASSNEHEDTNRISRLSLSLQSQLAVDDWLRESFEGHEVQAIPANFEEAPGFAHHYNISFHEPKTVHDVVRELRRSFEFFAELKPRQSQLIRASKELEETGIKWARIIVR